MQIENEILRLVYLSGHSAKTMEVRSINNIFKSTFDLSIPQITDFKIIYIPTLG